jgi:hypothetical protein
MPKDASLGINTGGGLTAVDVVGYAKIHQFCVCCIVKPLSGAFGSVKDARSSFA